MSEASITVTATASTSVPKGSPTRWATTSAWCTAAITAPMSATVQIAATAGETPIANATTKRMDEATGTIQVQCLIGASAGWPR